MKINVVYVTVDSIKEGVGQSQVLNLLKNLSKNNINITLISFEKNFKELEEITSIMQEYNIKWKKYLFEHSLIGILKRFLRIIKESKNYDVIHARGDFPALASLFIKNSRVLWDVRGLWPEQRIIIDKNVLKKIVFKILIKIRYLLVKNVDAITYLSEELEKYIMKKYKPINKISSVIPTCVDLEQFKYSKNNSRNNLIKIVLSGTYNNYYDLETTQKIINELEKENKVEVIWLKPNESKSHINFSNISYAATIKQLPGELSKGDLGIAICVNDEITLKGVMPTKIAEFLAVGTPVLVNSKMGDYDKWLRKYNAGVVIDTDNIDNNLPYYCSLIVELLQDKNTSSRCRKLAEDKLDVKKAADRYLEIYTKLSS